MPNKEKMFRITKIELDANGQLPTRFMLMQTGNWPNSVKGNFEITSDDLAQIKENFDAGIGFPTEDATTGLAIDFKHEYDDQAAGWIKGLELDTSDPDVTKLFANPVDWTDTGAKAVQSGQFKCVSPSGWFGRKNNRLSMWPDPQNLKNKVANVLDGAGLTNIPFLRGMAPIRASTVNDNFDSAPEYDKVIFISDDQQTNKEQQMTLDQIRAKEQSTLSAEETKFLLENAAELSDEERERFNIKQAFTMGEEEAGNGDGGGDGSSEGDQLSDEDSKLLADIKAGNKKVIDKDSTTVEPDRLTKLEATAQKYETEKAEGVVEAHVKRGAIKQDAASNWTKRLLAATGEERAQLEADLEALPTNENLAKEIGTGEEVAAGATARDTLAQLANRKVETAAKEGKELLYSEALKQVYRENPDLQKQDLAEQGVK